MAPLSQCHAAILAYMLKDFHLYDAIEVGYAVHHVVATFGCLTCLVMPMAAGLNTFNAVQCACRHAPKRGDPAHASPVHALPAPCPALPCQPCTPCTAREPPPCAWRERECVHPLEQCAHPLQTCADTLSRRVLTRACAIPQVSTPSHEPSPHA
jgi:hypothetical protein